MTKYIATLFTMIILLLDGFSLTNPGSILNWFMNVGSEQLLVHLIFAATLLTYALVPHVRYRLLQVPLFLFGFSAFVAGLVGIFSPDFFGYRSDIMLVVDIFFLLEAGVLTMLVTLESPVRRLQRVQEGLFVSSASHQSKPVQMSTLGSRSA